MSRRLTLIAGSGALASEVASALSDGQEPLQVLSLTDRTDLRGDVRRVVLAEPTRIVDAIREFRTTHVVFAGGVHLTDADREGLVRMTGSLGAIGRSLGDIGLAGLAFVYARRLGVKLVGAHTIAPQLMAPDGHIAGPQNAVPALSLRRRALKLARGVGRLDLGQSVVLSGRRAIAAEDAGGTDALLSRVAALRARGLAGNGRYPLILAKAVKPWQPRFVDLPAIGPRTVVGAADAGISAIVVEAGGTLLLDRAALQAAAEAQGVAVVGVRR
jgi:DUF1009 family protein